MTGFQSKRKMAQAKLNDDDDTQVYADTLLIVYQRGFADGKKAAQRPWVELTDKEYIHIRKTTYNAQRGLVAFYRAIETKLKEHNYD